MGEITQEKINNSIEMASDLVKLEKIKVPWMEVAKKEAQDYKGYKEQDSKLGKRIEEYSKKVRETGWQKHNWCAMFVNWCILNGDPAYDIMKKPKVSDSYESGRSASFKKYPQIYKKISKPVYGAIAVFIKHSNKNEGHTTFLYKLGSNGELLCLGGNQSDSITLSEYYEKNKSNSLEGFYLPTDYEFSDDEILEPEKYDIKELMKELFDDEEMILANPNETS